MGDVDRVAVTARRPLGAGGGATRDRPSPT